MRIIRFLVASAVVSHSVDAAAADPIPNVPLAPTVAWSPTPLPPPPPTMERHSTGMMVGGIVLTSLAGACFLAGVSVIIDDVSSGGGDFQGLAAAVIGGPLLGGGVIFSAIGIPLWVVGARMEPKHPEPQTLDGRAWLRPSLAVGPGSATLKWTF